MYLRNTCIVLRNTCTELRNTIKREQLKSKYKSDCSDKKECPLPLQLRNTFWEILLRNTFEEITAEKYNWEKYNYKRATAAIAAIRKTAPCHCSPESAFEKYIREILLRNTLENTAEQHIWDCTDKKDCPLPLLTRECMARGKLNYSSHLTFTKVKEGKI